MTRSETIANLVTALAKAQQAMANPKFDSQNPHFKSAYCSLAALRDAILPPLNAHGLSLIQPVTRAGDEIVCDTILFHETGEWVATSLSLPLPKLEGQSMGALATYLKRIALQALCCVAGDNDDDSPPVPAPVTDAVDTYTADGLAERITALLEERQVPPDRQALWWQEQRTRHGLPVPIAVLRQLYRRLRDEARKRPQQAQAGRAAAAVTPESSEAPTPPHGPAGALPERPREGAAWDTLRAHRSDPRLSEALRHRVQLVVAGTVPLSEPEANTLAGQVLDWLDATAEDPT